MKNLLIVCLCLAASCSALRGFTDAECGVIASQQGQREFIKRRAFRRGGFLPSAPLTGR